MTNVSPFIREALNDNLGYDDSFTGENITIIDDSLLNETDNDSSLGKINPTGITYKEKYHKLLAQYEEAEYKDKYNDLVCTLNRGEKPYKKPAISFKAIIISSLVFIIIILWFNVFTDIYEHYYTGERDPYKSLLLAVIGTIVILFFCLVVYIV